MGELKGLEAAKRIHMGRKPGLKRCDGQVKGIVNDKSSFTHGKTQVESLSCACRRGSKYMIWPFTASEARPACMTQEPFPKSTRRGTHNFVIVCRAHGLGAHAWMDAQVNSIGK